MLAFNRNEQLASLRAMDLGLQHPGTTNRADSSVFKGKFPEAAFFHCVHSSQHLPGGLPPGCVFPLGNQLSPRSRPRLDFGMRDSTSTGSRYH